MFSDKNYGLPKDLIEAAKRVHEKHLMEYDEDGHIDNPPEGTKGTKKDREKAAKMGLKGPHLEGEGRVTKKQKQNIPPLPVRKPKNEEVQFTEEELAEAFAIFLEENFHVDMLTEEDLDYVFEEEFPQWLEEQENRSLIGRALDYLPGYKSNRKEFERKARQSVSQNLTDFAKEIPNTLAVTPAGRGVSALRLVGSAATQAAKRAAQRTAAAQSIPKIVGAGTTATTVVNRATGSDKKPTQTGSDKKPTQTGYEGDLTAANEIAKQKATATAVQSDTGGPGETGVGDKIAKTPAVRKQVSAKPAASARKQVKRPASKPQSFGSLLRKVGGNAPATTATAAGRRKVALLDARARARTAARDAKVRRTGRGQLSWAKAAFEPKD